MAISVKVEDHSEEVREALTQAKERALEAIGLAAEGYAKGKAPKDTGRLQNSISHAVSGDSAYIGTNVEYAPYVEMGHTQEPGRYVPAIGKRLVASYVPPRPFIKPAVIEHVNEYKALAEQYMKGG